MIYPSLPAAPAVVALTEGFGDPVPWQDYPQNDWPDGSGIGSTIATPYTTIEDRADGRCRPLYDNEVDLARQRAQARRLSLITPIKEGAFEQLKRHTFGEGVTYRVAARKGQEPPAAVIVRLQGLVDQFVEINDLTNSLDVELHDRSREDGEALAWLRWENGVSRISVPEPDQLTEPAASLSLYDWLASSLGIDCSSFVPSWTFGVLSPQGDCSRPLAYYIAHDSSGRDWDIVPEAEMVHFRRNTPRKAKRGVSDCLTLISDLRNEAKLATNMIVGAALQAAIAWIEEMPAGVTRTQADGIGNADLLKTIPTNVGNGGGTRSVKSQYYGPGSIVRPSQGRQYKPGPMGAERNANFELASQYVLRRCGVRWSMPEYMISGDASNGNFASLLVAESPFVKAREADQQFYGAKLRELAWKAVLQAWKHGRLDSLGLSYRELQSLVDISVAFPEVATRNRLEVAQRLAVEKANGWVSDQTAMTELGRDPDIEKAQGAKATQPAIQPATQGDAPGTPSSHIPESTLAAALAGALQDVTTGREARHIIESIGRGTATGGHR